MARGDPQASRRVGDHLRSRGGARGAPRGGEKDAALVVLDASAAVELLLRPSEATPIARALLGEEARAPAHFDAEVFGGVRSELRRGRIDAVRAEDALIRLARLPVERVPLSGLLGEAFAQRDRFGAHDVFYAALARRLDATLVTSDTRLARAASGYVPVRLFAPASSG